MNKINFDNTNYSHKDDLKTLISSISEAVERFDKGVKSVSDELKKLDNAITKKEKNIEKLTKTKEDLNKKHEELDALRNSTKTSIEELEEKKKSINYEDAEVQKMEIEDIDSLIDVKKGKMTKISSKLSSTKDKIKTNEGNLKTQKKELEDLQTNKIACQDSLLRTNDFLEIVDGLEEELTNKLLVVLEKDYEIERDNDEEDLTKLEEEVKNGGLDNFKDPVLNSVPHFSEVNYNPPTVTFTGDNASSSTNESESSGDGEIPNISLNITAPTVQSNPAPVSAVTPTHSEDTFEEQNLDFDLGDDLDLTTKLDLDSITIDDDNKNMAEESSSALPEINNETSETPVQSADVEPVITEPTIAESIPAPSEDAFVEEQLNSLEPETSKVDVLPVHEEKDYEEKPSGEVTNTWEVKPIESKQEDEAIDYTYLNDIFNKESIKLDDFDEEDKRKMAENQDRVTKNLVVIKNHNIPLSYTVNQPNIYYDIDSQDLEDLLNIITSSEGGNGMGFSIDYTFNILGELAKIDVDKLIDVYNNEFMNINAKSGIINLLKKTNPMVGDFSRNRKANEEELNKLGIVTVQDISNNYPEFVNLDHPLFSDILNLFDRDDLVEKLNSDISVIPQILDYWKNN